MKAALLFAFPAIAVAIATNALADEKRSNASNAKAVPHKNYWDANLWDPFSGSGFWKENQDRRVPVRPLESKKQISPLLMPSSESLEPDSGRK